MRERRAICGVATQPQIVGTDAAIARIRNAANRPDPVRLRRDALLMAPLDNAQAAEFFDFFRRKALIHQY